MESAPSPAVFASEVVREAANEKSGAESKNLMNRASGDISREAGRGVSFGLNIRTSNQWQRGTKAQNE
jgi:hypothetical protein